MTDSAAYSAALPDLVAATRKLMVAVGSTDIDTARATATIRETTTELRARSRERLLHLWEDSPDGTPALHSTREAVSGTLNPLTAPVLVRLSGAGRMTASARLSPLVEGPPDAVHGGYLARIIDSLMGQHRRAGGPPGTHLGGDRERPTQPPARRAARSTGRSGDVSAITSASKKSTISAAVRGTA
ncbi:hypothetical protein [Sphaerimonospora thailandensis]|uniref:Uncharacterized protein n=1 Tax=Sphaerimonospora thailandensis TaxID=795644 RepID=A0A8J3RD60_9ACTN|nr:hypothetical protein [Sphaerimonospora thailandensis]GIH72435.1 hypothetical protein Mth01_46880 [Sphaerimonospora thailandensis]